MTGNKAREREREREGERERERDREVWGERERNMVETENGVGHSRRWCGLI